MSTIDRRELVDAEITGAPGLDDLLACLWREGGRGPFQAGWRPFAGRGLAALALCDGEQWLAAAVVRPAIGMDTIELAYARPGPDRARHMSDLLAWAEGFLAEHGITEIIYSAYSYWHALRFPADLAEAFRTRGYRTVHAVFMAHRLDRLPPLRPPPEGYRVEPIEDRRLEEAARMMLRSPEPEAIYWDYALCCRSIAGAAALDGPGFPDGLGQQVLGADGKIACFSLATTSGYVNHVYTAPEHRRRGLSAVALTRVLEAIKRRGAPRATILTHDTNPGAIRAYEGLGFRQVHGYPQFYLRQGGEA